MKPFTITISEFCRRVGVGKTSAYSLINRGLITKVRIQGRTLITVESVEALIARSKAGGE